MTATILDCRLPASNVVDDAAGVLEEPKMKAISASSARHCAPCGFAALRRAVPRLNSSCNSARNRAASLVGTDSDRVQQSNGGDGRIPGQRLKSRPSPLHRRHRFGVGIGWVNTMSVVGAAPGLAAMQVLFWERSKVAHFETRVDHDASQQPNKQTNYKRLCKTKASLACDA